MYNVYGDWYLDVDNYQFILGKLNPDKTHGDKHSALTDMSYHPRLSQAATFLLRRLQRELIFDRQVNDFETFITEANNLHDEITLKFDIVAEQLNAR